MGERWTAREFWQAECDRVFEKEDLPNLPYQGDDLYTHREMSELEDIEDDGTPVTEAMKKAIQALEDSVRENKEKRDEPDGQ